MMERAAAYAGTLQEQGRLATHNNNGLIVTLISSWTLVGSLLLVHRTVT